MVRCGGPLASGLRYRQSRPKEVVHDRHSAYATFARVGRRHAHGSESWTQAQPTRRHTATRIPRSRAATARTTSGARTGAVAANRPPRSPSSPRESSRARSSNQQRRPRSIPLRHSAPALRRMRASPAVPTRPSLRTSCRRPAPRDRRPSRFCIGDKAAAPPALSSSMQSRSVPPAPCPPATGSTRRRSPGACSPTACQTELVRTLALRM